MYVVTVTFRVKPAHTQAFLTAIRDNAATSLADESGCRQFDVCIGADGAETVFLYELYDDRAAFEAHLASAHFKAFDAVAADWVVDKQVAIYLRA